MRKYLRGKKTCFIETEDILLSREELLRHGRDLGRNHKIKKKTDVKNFLIFNLDKNFKHIEKIYLELNAMLSRNKDLPKASEWLLDNFYIIELQYKKIRQSLEEERGLELNTLENGVFRNCPRIYILAVELISHTEGVVTEETLIDFINSYQEESTLSIKEVSSLPLMLTLALMNYIRNICTKIENISNQWQKANEIDLSQIRDIEKYIEEMEEISSSFLERLFVRIKKEETQQSIFSFERRLNYLGTTVEKIIEKEHIKQANMKLKIGNSIISLKNISNLKWVNIFESLSIVEKTLKEDPLEVYRNMDLESKNYYIHHVQELAEKLNTKEIFIAKKALELARNEYENGNKGKESHVGYYIIDDGREEIFNSLNKKEKRAGFYLKSEKYYTLPVVLFTLFLVFLFGRYAYARSNIAMAILVGLTTLVPASNISIGIFNTIFSKKFSPIHLPKLEFKDGIPDKFKTFIVIPTLLTDEKRVEELVKQLEIHYLSNGEKNLYFGLIGDFKDGQLEKEKEDEKIIQKGLQAIEELNNKYSKDEKIFYYFHRDRVYSDGEEKWMGWERKRGALVEFNELILGNEDTTYSVISSDISSLKNKIKYIITLDADTKLPLESAKKLVGTIAHPLNSAIIDSEKNIVTEGYGIIQPRISIDIESSNKSLFTRIYAGQGGIDPYTTAVSDIYQDLFREGIFTGKGIYDLKVFQTCLKDSIPENAVLSHDLLESCYVRAGLATDVELIDGYPEKYNSYIMRLHRWVRGDWQLIRWLKSNRRNPISSISKWKIVDNMRRSLVPVSVLLTIIFGLTIFPGSIYFWIMVGLLAIFTPFIITLMEHILYGNNLISKLKLNGNIITGVKGSFYQGVLSFIFLPYEGYMMVDAILRTIYRVFFSKKNLLQWTTAFDMEKRLKNDLKSFFLRMRSSVLIGLATIGLTFLLNIKNIYAAIIIVILWIGSPIIAYFISKEDIEEKPKIETNYLREIARKTWDYYEMFTNEENNFLPPDNYQEYPYNGVAYRTSPTNIGFLWVGILSAKDLGYITISEMAKLLDKTISSVEKMEKWEGHLYNWYSTTDLEPLRPYFVSTVDSGNFISYLYALREGLKEYLRNPLIDKKDLQGLKDTINLIEDEELKSEIVAQVEEIEDISIDGLKELKDRLNNNIDLNKDKWAIKSLSRVEALLKEYRDYILDENNKYSLLDLKTYYEKLLKDTEDENIKVLYKNTQRAIDNIENLISRIERLIDEVDFRPLYNEEKELFSVGYIVEKKELLDSYYDLLASEARTTSYIAICRREVPVKHWFKLGRTLIEKDGYRGLASWTGTMFEYLMPTLIMKNYKNTLLDETYNTAIRVQENYCSDKNLPWGISESGFFAFDVNLNYQYKAFGVPQLGFKRGLKEDLVISPYSSILAIKFNPKSVISNVDNLVKEQMDGKYGLYEAIDFTTRRLPQNMDKGIVKSYMTHHQGMIFLSINNFLNGEILIDRFHRNPEMKTGELLLQEKIPMKVVVAKEKENLVDIEYQEEKRHLNLGRIYDKEDLKNTHCHILASGDYSTMITNKGLGYSKKDNIFINRWRKEELVNQYGKFIYINNLTENRYWSTTYEPTKVEPDEYKVYFSNDKVSFYRKDGYIETRMDIVLLSEEDGEIRKVTLTNNGEEDALLEVCSYFEIVGDLLDADISHPVFNNLFIRTEEIEDSKGIIAYRRKRREDQDIVYIVHGIGNEDKDEIAFEYETNRFNFIGRGNKLSNPQGLFKELTNTTGAVLDPIMSLKRRVKVKSGESKEIYFVTGIDSTKEGAIKLFKKYNDEISFSKAFELAHTRSQAEIGYLTYKGDDLKLYDELVSSLVFFNNTNIIKYRDIIKESFKGQEGLWAYGISGDIPIVLIIIRSLEGLENLKKILRAHGYWFFKGLEVDLVILCEYESSYYEPLYESIQETVFECGRNSSNIYIRKSNNMPYEDRALLFKWASLIIDAEEGLKKKLEKEEYIPDKTFTGIRKDYPTIEKELDLEYFNGYGGFAKGGSEYIIKLTEGLNTPLPWINVIANRNFGFIVSETGAGFSWAHNSRENKLTPWYNDAVVNLPGEIIYLRDDDTGYIWNITSSPIREKEDYVITHGQGYSKFNHFSQGIEQELTLYTALDHNIKMNLIKLKNHSSFERKLTLVYFVRPVLGVTDEITDKFIETDMDEKEEIFLIKNSTNVDFRNSSIFIGTSEKIKSYTGNRREFIGDLGSLEDPEALKKERLSNTVGIGYDPCSSIEVEVTIPSGSEKELVMVLGESGSVENGYSMIKRYRKLDKAKEELTKVKEYWKEKLEKIQIDTPELSMNLIMNNWLMYQTIVSRLWGRTGFYQVGGAFGGRDQIQDVMNCLYIAPEECKKQIINNCRHQFVEGDIQHWWHPNPMDKVHKGIRSKYSDDLLWLPFVVAEYLMITEDYSILEEKVPYIESVILSSEEQERYEVPNMSEKIGTVYEHCIKAIEKSLKFGERGIPLMGSGDWNDGMNKVGYKGKGESIWLGWFLGSILSKFVPICKKVGDLDRSKRYEELINNIKESIEKNGWDGDWYLRAYFDDGNVLGSKENEECRIDSIAQTWAVLSGLGTKDRNQKAMKSVEEYLVKAEEGMILLLSPPFDSGELDPGYIKSYVPGVRENGGQYTHAAAWVIGAFALMGEGDKAFKLFNIINPINHTRTLIECGKYKAEPYVMAADVYGVSPHIGRGGWTWYTGSSGWIYKVGLEHILGFRLEGENLYINPCIPKNWDKYNIKYKYFETIYNIEVRNPYKLNTGIGYIKLDGILLDENYVKLINDYKSHHIEVVLGKHKVESYL
ncbi:hypothetical protein L0P54_06735 [Anaerosalibacter bizertensis]|uniref:Glycosyl transferase n=1 Tax=Anaerosalibacter bizertensis TaxID=932217 RepID=A0A9Q4FMF5_9FIRM|nr:glucoamylase family protein [Anaerosalibacter bizertensis]MBV1818751.1 hypothetical protein [Bacteroidales bacterium MSK.15.36]MCG4565660.1 hypothetical protein [Anaerosalibacter bizertensis]MCG4582680.1 hypothetical protein [Anaerosalibacter bizertensis]